MLGSSSRPLLEAYDLAMLDLDGVVYVGGDAVPGAPAHLAAAREQGLRLAFITNNAARAPRDVAEHLERLGVPATPDDVVTSAQAAARVLVDRLGEGARVVQLGGEGVAVALTERGLRPVGVDEEADALVSGYGPELRWREIMRAAVRIADGLWWVATNTDGSIPTPEGIAPGHGVLVEALRRFTGVDPVVAGKPARPLLDETITRTGAAHPLMVGDRLDTDIAGGHAADVDALLVLTGVSDLAALVAAAPDERPTYLAPDLRGLLEPHPEVEVADDDGATVGGWRASTDGGRLQVDGQGAPGDWWRAAAVAGWLHLDRHGAAAEVSELVAPLPDDGPAAG